MVCGDEWDCPYKSNKKSEIRKSICKSLGCQNPEILLQNSNIWQTYIHKNVAVL